MLFNAKGVTIGSVETYKNKKGEDGAKIVLFTLGNEGLETFEVLTQDMQIAHNIQPNQMCDVILDFKQNNFGVRANLVKVTVAKSS